MCQSVSGLVVSAVYSHGKGNSPCPVTNVASSDWLFHGQEKRLGGGERGTVILKVTLVQPVTIPSSDPDHADDWTPAEREVVEMLR